MPASQHSKCRQTAHMSDPYRLHTLRLTLPEEPQPFHAVLAEHIPGLARNKVRQAISLGLVTVDGTRWMRPTAPVPAGEHDVVVDLRQGLRKPQKLAAAGRDPIAHPFTILHEDDHLVVVDKASGILSAPSDADDHGHVPELLRAYWRKQGKKVPYIGVVHRIDQATSGCLCFCLDRKVQPIIAQQFSEHIAERRYRCIVQGNPRQDKDTLKGKLGRDVRGRRSVVKGGAPGKSAITHFEVVNRYANAAELSVQLETGRTHQIRVHLSSIGCAIAGDPVYGLHHRSGLVAPRLMLHAHELLLDHPITGERLRVEAPLPPAYLDYQKMLSQDLKPAANEQLRARKKPTTGGKKKAKKGK